MKYINPNCFPQYAEAVLQCGTAPYTFTWEKSMDGFSFSYFGNSETVYIGGGCPPYPIPFFLRLTVRDGSNIIRQVTRLFWIGRTNSNSHFKSGNSQPEVTNENKNPILSENGNGIIQAVSPNPTSSKTNITVNLPENGILRLALVDINGNSKTIIYNGNITKGIHHFSIDANSLSSGSYTIFADHNQRREAKQLVIAR